MPFSCFLFRPRKRLEKHRKALHKTPTHHAQSLTISAVILILTVPFQSCFGHSPTNAAHSLSPPKAGTYLAIASKIAHSGSQGETGVLWMGALSLPSDRFARSENPAWPEGRTAYFAPFGSWPRVLPKNAESLRNSDALMRVAVPRRRGPAGLRRPTPPAERTVLAPISPRVQLCLRRPAFPLSVFIPGA